MAWAGSVKLPALLISRLWFNSRMSSCRVDGPGATPGSPTVNRVAQNKVGSDELEHYQHFQPFGLVAQLAERPVVCRRVEGATPFGSGIFSECSSVFRAPGLGPGGRRWKSCHSDQFQ